MHYKIHLFCVFRNWTRYVLFKFVYQAQKATSKCDLVIELRTSFQRYGDIKLFFSYKEILGYGLPYQQLLKVQVIQVSFHQVRKLSKDTQLSIADYKR